MSISQVRALPVGNALQVFLQPPAGAEFWRVLRKASDDFTGYDDPDAIVAHDGEDTAPVDDRAVINGIQYFYRAYYWDGAAWTASASATGTAAATYQDRSADAMSIVRDRLEAGLIVEVQRGELQHVDGGVPVLLAPPVFENTRWPVVTVHLQNEAPSQRFLGETFLAEESIDGEFEAGEGWLGNVQLAIIGWSLNPDERSNLRKALRRIIVANGAVFNQHGMVCIEFSQQDVEEFEAYAAPVYQSMCTFSCQAPVLVSASSLESGVADVAVSVIEP